MLKPLRLSILILFVLGGFSCFQASVYAAGSLVISEFRLRGPLGANDEFVEIYNDADVAHTVASISPGTGYAIAASDGVVRCTIPNGTVISARGHWLCVNSVGYSLAAYPSGNGTTATGDATYTLDIPDNAGIALFNNNLGGANFAIATRLDAAGSTSEASTLYKEGTGYPPLTPFSIDYSWVRDECGKSGSISTLGSCPVSTPRDTDNNAVDFYFVDVNGTSAGAGQRLGAPSPQNSSSPFQRNSTISAHLVDSTVAANAVPNRLRDPLGSGGSLGTLSIRRRFENNTGAPVTRLRFHIIDLNTFLAPPGFADLRPRTSSLFIVVVNDSATCAAAGTTAPCNITVQGTTLEQPPNQLTGGGFNSTWSAGTVTLATPLAAGGSINVQFLMGVELTGNFRLWLNVEALP